jgi:PEGA domain
LRVLVILALLLSLLPRPADAKSIGLLVTGEYLKGPTQQQAEKWLTEKGHKVVTSPLPAEAVKTLLNCFVLDDPKCMRGVVEARASTPTLVSIRVDITSKKAREIRLTIDWFAKGHSPASARRTCDKCTEDVLRSTIDTMLEDLAKTAPGFTGRIKLTSDPEGMTILMDNKTVGVTPLELTVPTGSHTFKLVQDGRTGPEKTVDVSDQTIDLALEGPPAAAPNGDVPQPTVVVEQRRSRLVPGLMIGIGLAGVGAGVALYLTAYKEDGSQHYYYDNKNLGIGVAAGGAALALTGVIIILATKSTTGPTVSMTPGGASVGWAGSF